MFHSMFERGRHEANMMNAGKGHGDSLQRGCLSNHHLSILVRSTVIKSEGHIT